MDGFAQNFAQEVVSYQMAAVVDSLAYWLVRLQTQLQIAGRLCELSICRLHSLHFMPHSAYLTNFGQMSAMLSNAKKFESFTIK